MSFVSSTKKNDRDISRAHYVTNWYRSVCKLPMMTSSNGNIFRVIGPLWGESTGHGGFPSQRSVTRSFDVFFDLNKRLSKQSWRRWFEGASVLLWRNMHGIGVDMKMELVKILSTINIIIELTFIEFLNVQNELPACQKVVLKAFISFNNSILRRGPLIQKCISWWFSVMLCPIMPGGFLIWVWPRFWYQVPLRYDECGLQPSFAIDFV